MNKVMLIGNLTADPIANTFTSGSSNCRFTLAVSRYNPNGEDSADFIGITVWNKIGESCVRYLTKGSKVAVIGRIQTGSYEKDGRKVYTTDVIAEQVEFLTRAGESGGNSAPAPRKDDIDTLQPVTSGIDDGDIPF